MPVAGDVIAGKVRLLRELRAGGMGAVWVAHHDTLGIDVAVKVLGAGASATDTARLFTEAQAAARIAHEGVVRILDVEETSAGAPCIVMELLSGETLADRLDRDGVMKPEQAVGLLLPVAHALAALAEGGIVHRDLKPENIFLVRTAEGRTQPKLVDFGVALLSGGKRLTEAGFVVGTPDYFAPEQALGEALDPRVDVWAFSVVLFEALSGKLPFSGASTTAVLQAITGGPPLDVKGLGLGDATLEDLLSRGLCRDREGRIPSMRVYGEALAAWALERGIVEDVAGGSIRARWLPRLAVSGGEEVAVTPEKAVTPVKEVAPTTAVRSPGRPRSSKAAGRARRAGRVVWAVGVVGAAIVGVAIATLTGLARSSPAAAPTVEAQQIHAAAGPRSEGPPSDGTPTDEPRMNGPLAEPAASASTAQPGAAAGRETASDGDTAPNVPAHAAPSGARPAPGQRILGDTAAYPRRTDDLKDPYRR